MSLIGLLVIVIAARVILALIFILVLLGQVGWLGAADVRIR